MAVLDIVILTIIAVLAIMGYFQGLIREIAQVLGMIVGVVLAVKFAVTLAASIPPSGWSLVVKTPIAAVLILIATYLVFFLIGFIVRKILIHGPLKLMDRTLGMLLGIIKGVILVVIIIAVMLVSPAKGKVDQWTKNSPVARAVVEFTKPLVEEYYEEFEDAISKKIKSIVPKTDKWKANTQQEIVKLFKDLSGKKNQEEIKEHIKNLSPEARDYLKDLVEKARDGAKESSSSVDFSWLSKQIPIDEVAKALGLD